MAHQLHQGIGLDASECYSLRVSIIFQNPLTITFDETREAILQQSCETHELWNEMTATGK
jgi:hypothetical protein